MNAQRLLASKEASEYTGAPRDYLLNQAKLGNLSYVQPSPKKIMFFAKDLDRWMLTWRRVETQ
jgi:hypothetical protein